MVAPGPFAIAHLKVACAAMVALASAFARAVANRRRVVPLLELSDRELRDIGLTREDLRAALSYPLARDPSVVLMVRAVDRRSRRLAARRAAERQSVREPAV